MRQSSPQCNVITLRPIDGEPGTQSLATLERRLDDGYARIEHARSLGQDITAWEDFWIDLLRQYELACDSLPEAA